MLHVQRKLKKKIFTIVVLKGKDVVQKLLWICFDRGKEMKTGASSKQYFLPLLF